MYKRGLSPVIATILLIAMALVLASIIFLWARAFISESCEKGGSACELSCEDISFVADFDSSNSQGELGIENTGNIPIYRVDVKEKSTGITKSLTISEEEWQDKPFGIDVGSTATIDVEGHTNGDIIVIPKILGTSGNAKQTHICEDSAIIAEKLTI